ncbi:DUF2520 domain-containing protein [Flavobacterium sp. NST-5]|uniref:DUF2520 domain-containing protein n=1 Tax=Flavobacterium ichthyis TaxID=2698827 RepID=A0ABW9Z6P1_9FLAO|nr:DUF2520 domain-containing protein [Flavobacterium ichthyis]NBL64319.1 DUF2520 domain-containing protein [Flavobacterium ichthyis]
MIKIVVIGSGNVAKHLVEALSQASSIELLQVFARQKSSVENWIASHKIISNFDQLADADVYIIAVSDAAIAEVSAQIPFEKKLVVHTSGTVAFTEIDPKNQRGVWYPLQTFSKNKNVDFSEIPFCLESEFAEDYPLLEKLTESLNATHYLINGEQRKALHLAAVFVNNFTNHLYQMGKEICDENLVPFEILKPLIAETSNKIKNLSPLEAQTGPAKRQDIATINRHLEMLSDENKKSIYQLLTQSIQKTNVKKL